MKKLIFKQQQYNIPIYAPDLFMGEGVDKSYWVSLNMYLNDTMHEPGCYGSNSITWYDHP